MRRAPLYLGFMITMLLSVLPASAQTVVQNIEVKANLDAIRNVEAASHWATLADDLENAIAARVVGRTDEENGADITIDIDTVTLANSLEAAVGVAQSTLVGNVIVRDSPNDETYTLTITFEQAGPFLVPGTDLSAITTNSREYYDAMINAFADHVVRELG
jgi:hypothetical protein